MGESRRFPDGFWWGTSTSSHQVEGNNTNNDWSEWERQPGRIRDASTCGDAAQWWDGKAEEDLTRSAQMGHTAHRMSLEWSRIEPSSDHFDRAAFDRYRQILGHAKTLGLRTMVTLNHFTLPRWAMAAGSWMDPALARRFETYAVRCGDALGDLVDRWATLNEPNVLAFFAYAGKRWPPGLGKLTAFGTSLTHMLTAHALAYRAMARQGAAPIGAVFNFPVFDPDRPHNRLDRWVVAAQDWAMTGGVLRALQTGRLAPPISLRPMTVEGLAGSLDWVGLNYYGRFVARFDPRATADLFGKHVQQPTVSTPWTDWGQSYPAGLTRHLLRLRELKVPIFVTENGVYDNADTRRPDFIKSHVRAVHDAISGGADVRGFFHWSLVDNFEWAEGWSTHFGLLALDRATQSRSPRGSAGIYSDICRANAVEG